MIHAYIILLFVRLLICLFIVFVDEFVDVRGQFWGFGRLLPPRGPEGLELRSRGLATSAFTHWATSPAPDV